MSAPDGFRDMASVAEFLAHAIALEQEAAERFDELADTLETHNNAEGVVELFRKMAHYSRLHLAEARERAGDIALPNLAPWDFKWPGDESPETPDHREAHYRMTAWHALSLTLASERQAHAFYGALANHAADAEVRALAAEFTEEEAEHVEILEDWLARTPEPAEDWDHDPEPPVAVD